jgi:methionine synthase / methylenetetrahydrofolate reductase(NADPH)
VGCALNPDPGDIDKEIKTLRNKIKAGADFLLTQPIYDPPVAARFLARYMDQFGALEIPLVVGILPLVNARHASFLAQEVPGINIPEDILKRMQQSGEGGARAGIEIALELIEQVKAYAGGIYLIPAFNRFDQAAEIIESVREGLLSVK